jgi:hypothetical protein
MANGKRRKPGTAARRRSGSKRSATRRPAAKRPASGGKKPAGKRGPKTTARPKARKKVVTKRAARPAARSGPAARRPRGRTGFGLDKPWDSRGLGLEAGGQSGDTEGLPRQELADSESIEELVEEGQAFEAGVVGGVENARDADKGEVRTREVPEDDVPQEYLDED